ncbi:MAG TPA: 3-oxoacyl-ACP reductase family protein [Candidatus Binataceae bacterium]|nr:3-oxoacyl-ACP reductase family protein [Candidatus Binataceae bacterium]
MGKLDGKFALITGSSSGIGRAVALAFAREGAHVAINFPDQSQSANAAEVEAALKAMGRRAIAIEADISKEDRVGKLVNAMMQEFGRIDILVNNAGIGGVTARIEDLPISAWDEVMAVNLRGVFLCTRAVLPIMYRQNYGKIINTASQLAYRGCPGMAHYTASKAAIITFTRSLAMEIGNRNVNANCVGPGITRTPILAGTSPELIEAIKAGIPKGRLAEVEDIVPAYVFLASDESGHFVGQCLSPNGGDVML